MNWKLPAALTACAVIAAALALPADAAPRKKRLTTAAVPGPAQSTVFITRGEDGRTRTKLIVTRRSYLDGGTEVLPGQRKYTDYALPPFRSAIGDAFGPGRNYDRQPLNPMWETGGYRTWY